MTKIGYRLLAVTLPMLVICICPGCGGGGGSINPDTTATPTDLQIGLPPAQDNLADNPAAGAFNITAPLTLMHQTSAESSTRDGDEFEAGWPHQRVAPSGTGSLFFSPHWDDADRDQADMSYALYSLTVPEPADYYTILFDWQGAENDYDNLWLGVGNFDDNRWDWQLGQSSNALAFAANGHENSSDQVYLAVVCIGNSPWELHQLTISSAQFGINGVSPLIAASGSLTTFSAVVVGGNPTEDSYTWDFGGAAIFELINGYPVPLENGVSHQVSPQLLLEDYGEFEASLSVVLQIGPSVDPFPFTLDVISTNAAPEIIAIHPRYEYDEGAGLSELYVGSSVEQDVQAICTGTRPLSYAWNFAGGATPGSFSGSPEHVSVEITPMDTFPVSRTVFAGALLNVENAAGEDARTFDLVVGQPPTFHQPEGIHYWGEPGAQKQFSPQLRSGSPPVHFSWFFGGAAQPNTYEYETGGELVTSILGTTGNYQGTLAANNAYTDPESPTTAVIFIHVGVPCILSVMPLHGNEGTVRTFSAEIMGSIEVGDLQPTYSWDFGGGVTPNTSPFASPNVLLGDNGSYDCTLVFTNKYGSDQFDFTLVIQDTPVADLQAMPNPVDPDLPVSFDASGSTDSDGTIVRYDWDWDSDGNYEIEDGDAFQQHIYTTLGSVTATVRVWDDDSAKDTASSAIKVVPQQVSNLAATDGMYYDKIRITWNEVTGADGYKLQYKNNDGGAPSDWTDLVTVSGGSTTRCDHTWDSPVGKESEHTTSYEYQAKATYQSDESNNWSATDTGFRIEPELTSVLYFDDLDGGASGGASFTMQDNDGTYSDTWELGDGPTYGFGTGQANMDANGFHYEGAALTGHPIYNDGPIHHYGNNNRKTLYWGPMDFSMCSTDPMLWVRCYSDLESTGTYYDRIWFGWSSSGTHEWNDNPDAAPPWEYAETIGDQSSKSTPVLLEMQLTGAAGQTGVYITVCFSSDGSVDWYPGTWLDNFCVGTYGLPSTDI